MKLLRFFTAALMSLSMVGCCCSRGLVSDACDPCGAAPARGCSVTKLFKSPFNRGYGWENTCTCGGCGAYGGDITDPYSFPAYGSPETSSCGGSCGSPGMSMSPMTSSPMMGGMSASPSCGCAQSANYPSMPSMSAPSYSPSYSPSYAPSYNTSPTMIPPVPPASTVPQPVPENPSNYAPSPPMPTGSEPTTRFVPGNGQQPQMVSYEEFQRLPGNVISGAESLPTAGNPAPIQQVSTSSPVFMAPPAPTAAPSTSSKFTRPASGRQAVWTPAR